MNPPSLDLSDVPLACFEQSNARSVLEREVEIAKVRWDDQAPEHSAAPSESALLSALFLEGAEHLQLKKGDLHYSGPKDWPQKHLQKHLER